MTWDGNERRSGTDYRRLAITTFGIAFAMFILVALGGWALKRSQDHAARDACRRANVNRAESNRRIESHLIDVQVLRQFLSSARDARFASYERDRQASDLKAAKEYQTLIGMLRNVTFKRVPLARC